MGRPAADRLSRPDLEEFNLLEVRWSRSFSGEAPHTTTHIRLHRYSHFVLFFFNIAEATRRSVHRLPCSIRFRPSFFRSNTFGSFDGTGGRATVWISIVYSVCLAFFINSRIRGIIQIRKITKVFYTFQLQRTITKWRTAQSKVLTFDTIGLHYVIVFCTQVMKTFYTLPQYYFSLDLIFATYS